MKAKWLLCNIADVPILGIWSHNPKDLLEDSYAYLRIHNSKTEWAMDSTVVVGVSLHDGHTGFCSGTAKVYMYVGEE